MMIESFIAYLAIIAPSAITIITALFAIFTAIAKFVKIVKENKSFKDEIIALVKKEDDKITAVLNENAQLKHALAECTEALTRIRNKHPKLFAEKEE